MAEDLHAGDGVTTHGELTVPASLVRAAALQPGLLFAERYRIVELLGSGGMGEVYRAHDTMLDVQVALKLVSRARADDAAHVVREVRLARQITHRSVCRVFDVGETGGEHYITMEYVDGEDLGALLRRIGRFPGAKVIELARQLCAGLAAAHAQGILHRDLKPANIMIDRRGNARITDFGIAVLEGTIGDGRLTGTPAYMAPEQIAGRPASPQSDLYALGLVLYELVTGRYAFDVAQTPDGRRRHAAPAPSALVSDVDPALERVILRALAADQEQRPQSAVAFSAALPGGDVLAAVLEADQTPSPDLVASAGVSGRLSPRVGASLLAAAVAGLAVIVVTARVRPIDKVPLGDPPAVLVASARAFLREVAPGPPAAHYVSTLQADDAYLQRFAMTDTPLDATRLARLIYRESPDPIVPALILTTTATTAPFPFAVTLDNPPMSAPGMKAVVLELDGRLRSFRVVPEASAPGPDRAVDWAPFLRMGGIDPASLTPETPTGLAPPYGSRRLAWRARGRASGEALHIEAAAGASGPTWFEVHRAGEESSSPDAEPSRIAGISGVVLSVLVIAAAFLLARRNLQHGRSDMRGARRLASFLFATRLGSWLLGATFLPLDLEFARLLLVVSLLLTSSLLAAALYVALEPFVRRRWPSSLIAWNRLIAGRLNDPLVGRDVLIGAATSIVGTALYHTLIVTTPGFRGERSFAMPVSIFMGERHLLSSLIEIVPDALTSAMTLALVYSLLVMLLRRGWLATPVFLGILAALTLLQVHVSPIEFLVLLIGLTLWVVVFVRFGLLSLTAYLLVDRMLLGLPLSFTGDWRSEFAVASLLAVGAILTLAAYTSLRMRPA